MKSIITSAYKENQRRFHCGHFDNEDIFTAGWLACEEWQVEQEAMDRDYQEELQEQDRLRRGQ